MTERTVAVLTSPQLRSPGLGGETVLDIEVDEADSFTVCRPVGELDAYTVGQFRDVLGELAEKRNLLIDLSAVPFMDSAGLGALIGGIRRAREAGGDVAVACSRPTLTRLLHTTGFDRIVPVTETVDGAAAALDASSAASLDE
ncbi:MAG TPA: STAS domain-containing protein [Acidimicrobiales bacterium]